MELSIPFLQCMIRDDQKQEHVESNAMMSQIGPYLGDEYLYLVLYCSYAIVFKHLMNSTIVQVARSYGRILANFLYEKCFNPNLHEPDLGGQ